MKTKWLRVTSSMFLAVVGAAASFAPYELLLWLKAPATEPLPVLIQLLGGLYAAFAIANWTAGGNLIGGIYGRPLALGNCLHFIMGMIALAKYQIGHGIDPVLLAVLMAYTTFALGFSYLVFVRGAACVSNAPTS